MVRGSHGFSLIELMVSLTIGLIIAIAAMSAYLGASSASRMTDVQSRMNEDAQAALTILSQQLQMAGNNPNQTNRVAYVTPSLGSLQDPVYNPTPPSVLGYVPTYLPTTFTLSNFSIRGCDGKFTNISGSTNLDALNCGGGTTTLPDSIAVSYQADPFNTEATSGGLATDCLGNALPIITASNVPVFNTVTGTVTTAAITYTVADNRFYVGTSTVITSPSLYCQGNGGASTPQPLVENIEDMQFQYGTMSATSTSTTATVAGYLTANEVITQTDLAALSSDAERWRKVLSVRICVVVRSDTSVVSDANSAKYRDCTGSLVSASDLRLRRAYFATVALRNRRP